MSRHTRSKNEIRIEGRDRRKKEGNAVWSRLLQRNVSTNARGGDPQHSDHVVDDRVYLGHIATWSVGPDDIEAQREPDRSDQLAVLAIKQRANLPHDALKFLRIIGWLCHNRHLLKLPHSMETTLTEPLFCLDCRRPAHMDTAV